MSQIAEKKFPITVLFGGLSVNLNHLKSEQGEQTVTSQNIITNTSILILIQDDVWFVFGIRQASQMIKPLFIEKALACFNFSQCVTFVLTFHKYKTQCAIT